jgi:hypothetical protein
MANSKWIIGFPRYTESITYSGGSWESNYPLNNIKVLPFAKVARSTNDANASTILYGVLPSSKPLELFMICNDNISINANIKITLYDGDITSSPAPAEITNTGWLKRYDSVYDEFSPFASWDSGNFHDRTFSADDLAGSPRNKVIYIQGGNYARSFTLEIDDEDNADGFVQIGLLEVASAVTLDNAPQLGANYGFNSRTTITQSEGGAKYFERRNKARVFSGVLPYYNRSTALNVFYELFRRNDIDTPFIWYPDIDDVLNQNRNAFLARNAGLDLFSRVLTPYDAIPINIEEVL